MGKYFSDAVDNAIEAIYYTYDKERAAACLQSLADASNAGDGDASYILSRCTSGPHYSWKDHPFQENDEVTEQLIRKSILQGSAMGVLGAMRCGMLTPEMEEAMPFATLKEAWNTVYEKAQAGCLFAMNMIGNTYFWLDVVRIEGQGPNDFPSKEAFGQWLRESELKCIPWFEKAFRGGMGFAGLNLYNLYNNGEEGLVEPQKEKALEVERLGAELGYPDWMERYAKTLTKTQGREKEGIDLAIAAAKKGQLSAWYYPAQAYQLGKGVQKDLRYAMECCEKGLAAPDSIGCANIAGEMYFEGKDGIPQDRARAVQLFEQAHRNGNNWVNDMLGTCCLFGYGCPKDPVRARALFQEADYSSDLKSYGLGVIYTEGLGIPADIKKGVEYFQKAKDYAPAKEALLHFKKTLFGKWVRK